MIFLYITAIAFWTFVLYYFFRPQINRLEFRIERTFWENKIWGLTVTLWDRPAYYNGCRSGTCLFTLRFRDPENDDINKRKR